MSDNEFDPTVDPLYPAKDVAKMLGISTYTLRIWIEQGRIKGRKIQGRWRIPKSEVKRVANEEHG